MKDWDGDNWGTALTVTVWVIVSGGGLFLTALAVWVLVH